MSILGLSAVVLDFKRGGVLQMKEKIIACALIIIMYLITLIINYLKASKNKFIIKLTNEIIPACIRLTEASGLVGSESKYALCFKLIEMFIGKNKAEKNKETIKSTIEELINLTNNINTNKED